MESFSCHTRLGIDGVQCHVLKGISAAQDVGLYARPNNASPDANANNLRAKLIAACFLKLTHGTLRPESHQIK